MQVKYDLLVGADGVSSTVRAEMEKQLPGMSGQSSLSLAQYKESSKPPAPALSGPLVLYPGSGSH